MNDKSESQLLERKVLKILNCVAGDRSETRAELCLFFQ